MISSYGILCAVWFNDCEFLSIGVCESHSGLIISREIIPEWLIHTSDGRQMILIGNAVIKEVRPKTYH